VGATVEWQWATGWQSNLEYNLCRQGQVEPRASVYWWPWCVCDVLQLGILLVVYASVVYCQSKWIKRIEIHTEIANTMQQCIKIYYFMFIWSSTCFGRRTAHHQELKSALAASGFAYVKDCWMSRLLDADSPAHFLSLYDFPEIRFISLLRTLILRKPAHFLSLWFSWNKVYFFAPYSDPKKTSPLPVTTIP
jgi:hypothetical protein